MRVVLTLRVDTEKSKTDIRDYFNDMEAAYTQNCTSRNRWEFGEFTVISVEEEADIYETED